MPNLEITDAVLIHCSIANNDYQQDSRVLNKFISNKSIIRYFTKKCHFLKKLLIQDFHILKYSLLTKILKR